jgi:hypothetical protein
MVDPETVNQSMWKGSGGLRTEERRGAPGCVDVVEVAATNQDVESLVGPGRVGHHAGGTHVQLVVLSVLHPLHDAYLTGGVMAVVDWSGCQGWRLAIAADTAHRTRGQGVKKLTPPACATPTAGARTSLGPIGQFIQKFKMQGTPCPIFLLNS